MTSHCSLPEGQPENCTGVSGEEGMGRGGRRGPHGYTAPLLASLGSIHNIYIQIHIYIYTIGKTWQALMRVTNSRVSFWSTDIQCWGGLGRVEKNNSLRKFLRFRNAPGETQELGKRQITYRIPNDSILTAFSTLRSSWQRFSTQALEKQKQSLAHFNAQFGFNNRMSSPYTHKRRLAPRMKFAWWEKLRQDDLTLLHVVSVVSWVFPSKCERK